MKSVFLVSVKDTHEYKMELEHNKINKNKEYILPQDRSIIELLPSINWALKPSPGLFLMMQFLHWCIFSYAFIRFV